MSTFTDRLRRQPAERARLLAALRSRRCPCGTDDDELVAVMAGWLAPFPRRQP